MATEYVNSLINIYLKSLMKIAEKGDVLWRITDIKNGSLKVMYGSKVKGGKVKKCIHTL